MVALISAVRSTSELRRLTNVVLVRRMNGGRRWTDCPRAVCWRARAPNVVERCETRPLRSLWRAARSVTR